MPCATLSESLISKPNVTRWMHTASVIWVVSFLYRYTFFWYYTVSKLHRCSFLLACRKMIISSMNFDHIVFWSFNLLPNEWFSFYPLVLFILLIDNHNYFFQSNSPVFSIMKMITSLSLPIRLRCVYYDLYLILMFCLNFLSGGI